MVQLARSTLWLVWRLVLVSLVSWARRPVSSLTLEELLTRVNDENLHVEIDAGPAMGAEDW
jgi:hypothetical protein